MDKHTTNITACEISVDDDTITDPLISHAALVSSLVQSIPPSTSADNVFVAIDGPPGAGKSTLASALATALRAKGRAVVCVSIDHFMRARGNRFRTASELWLSAYQYAIFEQCVLAPLRPGGSRRYCPAIYDNRTRVLLDWEWRDAPEGSVVIVEGIFLLRDELVSEWHMSIFLDAKEEIWIARAVARERCDAEKYTLHHVPAFAAYRVNCRPMDRASIVVQIDELERPLVLVNHVSDNSRGCLRSGEPMPDITEIF